MGPADRPQPVPATRPAAWARRRVWVLPLVVLVAACLPRFFGGRWGVDTGWYAGIALKAWREGHWWTLVADDRPYFNKPPLGFWVHGAFLEALGPRLWVIRLSMLLAAAGCVLATIAIVRRLSGPRVAMVAGLVLAATIEFFRLADRLRLDFLTLLFMLGAVWCVVDGFERRRGWPVALAGVPLGLALMTKPLVALVSVPILGAWLALAGAPALALWLAPATGAALAIAAPWHVSMWAIHGEAFVGEYFWRQTLARGRGTLFEGEPWWWYLAFLGRNHWPWLAAIGLAAAGWARGRTPSRGRAGGLLAVAWSVAWLAALSLFADKRKQYLLPIYPTLAWIAALGLVHGVPAAWRRAANRWLDRAVAGAVVVSVAATAIVAPGRLAAGREWDDLERFIVEHRPAVLWNGGAYYNDAAMVYVRTGLWPREMRLPGGQRREPPSGSLVLYDTDDTPPPPGDEAVFRSGKLVVVRAAAAAEPPSSSKPAADPP